MRTVGAFEAKTRFSALIEEAERGEIIVVTKKGKPVAQIGPVRAKATRVRPQEAMKKLLSMDARLGGISIRKLIEEGRRF